LHEKEADISFDDFYFSFYENVFRASIVYEGVQSYNFNYKFAATLILFFLA